MDYEIKDFEKKRWVSFIGALFVCICAGFGYAWSVFQTPFVQKFGWDAADVSLTFTLTIIMSTMSPLFLSGIIKRLKTRQVVFLGGLFIGAGLFFTAFISSVPMLYLTYGVLSGIGVGLIYPSLMAYSVMLFPDKKGMASGCMAAAYGSGAVIWAPVASGIIETYSIGAAFKFLGVLYLAVIVLASFLLKQIPEGFIEKMLKKAANKKAEAASQYKVEDKTRRQMAKTATFYIMVIIFTFGLTSGLMVIGQASPILQVTLGYTPTKAAVFVGFLALFNTFGRLFWGMASDKLGRFNVVIYLLIIAGVSLAGLSISTATIVVIAAMALIESCYGAFSSIIAACTSDMFGTKNLTENYGLMYIVFGFASILGPRIAVSSVEQSGGSYEYAYIIAIALSCVGLILSILLRRIDIKRKKIINKGVQV